MTHTHLQQTGTATAVPGERADATPVPTPYQPVVIPPDPLPATHHAPIRRRVERIAVRYAPQPPQRARKSVSMSPRSRNPLVVNRKIKAQPATHPRP